MGSTPTRRQRTQGGYLEALGYRVIRFWNDEVLRDPDAVLEEIGRVLIEIPSPYPLPKGEGKKWLSRRKRKATLHASLQGRLWSIRTMANACGASHATVNRIWRAHELKPHLMRTFKLSSDKRFTEKLRDIVGLYLNPLSMLWCCASTRNPRSRRWIELSLACR